MAVYYLAAALLDKNHKAQHVRPTIKIFAISKNELKCCCLEVSWVGYPINPFLKSDKAL